jgi:hypothetical protein
MTRSIDDRHLPELTARSRALATGIGSALGREDGDGLNQVNAIHRLCTR